MKSVAAAVASLLVASSQLAGAIPNGLALTPPMGLSTWNLASSDVSIRDVKTQVPALIRTKLASAGYGSFHVDEGWLKGRNKTTGTIIVETDKFPDGMKAAGDWVHNQTFDLSAAATRRVRAAAEFHGQDPDDAVRAASRFTYWLYTSRGKVQCGTSRYSAPGSQGHERADAAFFAAAGADGAKIDSCGGVQEPDKAIADYALWRDALNATGRPMVFSLCGWKPLYAPPGHSLGNLWRISGDGRSWGPLTEALNHNAYLGEFAGPGGWNDPDLMQGDGSGCHGVHAGIWFQTNNQSRAQMSLWAVTAAPLIISASVADSNAFLLDTWGNDEVIDVDQDPMGVQGGRIVGSDMYTSGESNFSGVNVWARPLVDGSWALALLNNNQSAVNVTCGPSCLGRLTFNSTPAASPREARDRAVAAMRLTGDDAWGNAIPMPGVPGTGFSSVPDDGHAPSFFADCGSVPSAQQAFSAQPDGTIVHAASGKCLTVWGCSGADATPVGLQDCGGGCPASQTWSIPSGSSPGPVRSGMASACLDQYHFNTSFADLYACNGGQNQAFTLAGGSSTTIKAEQSGQCLTAPPAVSPSLRLRVRDLWARQDVGIIHPATDTISAMLAGNGSVAMYRLWRE